MGKLKSVWVVIVFLLMALAIMALPVQGNRQIGDSMQSWPSRTPTPARVTPSPGKQTPLPTLTATPPLSGSPPTESPPRVTMTTPEETTQTPTASVTTQPNHPGESNGELVGTSSLTVEQILAVTDCTVPPIALALSLINVRLGPGIEYAVIGSMDFQEARPIIGRSNHIPWWLIQLRSGSRGWVSDQAVTVKGFIGSVPIVAAPPTDGTTPSPGADWQPTANPKCTPPASPTIVPDEGSRPIRSEVTLENESQELLIDGPVASTPVGISLVTGAGNIRTSISEESAAGEGSGSSLMWLFLLGIGFIVGGLFVYLLQGKNRARSS